VNGYGELELFSAVIAISDHGERAALLEHECAGRPELGQRIAQLLDAHFKSDPLLDHSAYQLATTGLRV
jgi:hypothetical protein